ncbi:MAG: hypothetical protein Q9183_003333, partial [Haloplaca sp. 2 TL-2023]
PDAATPTPNILLLSKSTGSLIEQIQEARKILELEFSNSQNISSPSQNHHVRQGAREEWTLRWLLKKLEGAEVAPQSVLLEVQAWQLFQDLILCLPLTNLARLLRDHTFLGIVLNALKSLGSIEFSRNSSSSNLPGSARNGSPSNTSSGADSSSVTVGAPVQSPRTSKKRKRNGAVVDHSFAAGRKDVDGQRVFNTLCGILRQLQTLCQNQSYGYAREHLKMAMETHRDQAASLLGESIAIIHRILPNLASPNISQGDTFAKNVMPWIRLWKSRSSSDTGTAVDLLFANRCFVPVLKLLTTLESFTTVSPVLNEVQHMLEDVLLLHVIVPVRVSFENRRRSRDAQDKEAAGAGIDEILTPLEDLTSSSNSLSHQTEKYSQCIAGLFHMVIKHTPLATAKQRTAEKSWLQYMFDHITRHAVILTDLPIAHHSSEYPVEALKMMLKMLSEKGMQLEKPTLRKILTEISNMFDGRPGEVEWELISLCLRMDPDVFVVPEAPDGSNTGSTKGSPNEFLVALAATLSDLARRPPRVSQYMMEEMVEHVIVPLVNGFADARNLSGFVNHWRFWLLRHHLRNQNSEKQSSANPQATSNVWEDERVLQEVAKLIEARMTAKQVDAMLLEANSALATDFAGSSLEHRISALVAELVILDCILHACSTDDICAKVSETSTKIYSALVSMLLSWQAYPVPKWRIYRCMTVLKRRWIAEIDEESDMMKGEATVVSSALEMFAKADTHEGLEDVEELEQAFNYTIAVIGKASRSLSGELARSLIVAISKALNHHHQWIMSGKAGAQAEHQTAFFKALFLCSIVSPAPDQQVVNEDFSFTDSWQKLLRSTVLQEHDGVASMYGQIAFQDFQLMSSEETFQAFQIDALRIGPLGKNIGQKLTEMTVHQHALSSIHQTSMRGFNRKQRASIFNQVTDTLIQDAALSLQSAKDHLQILSSCIQSPNSSMALLKHPFGVQGKEQKPRKHADEPPALFKIAHRLNSQLAAAFLDIELVQLLKSFAHDILIYQLARGLGDGATMYLDAIFNHLVHLIRHQYWQGESFSTVLLGSALDFFKSNMKDLPDQLRPITEQLPSLREEFRRRLRDHVHLLCQGRLDDNAIDQAIICIDSLTSCKDLVLASSDIETLRADCQHISAGLFARMTASDDRGPFKSNSDRWLQIIQEAQHWLEEPHEPPSVMARLEAGEGGDGRSNAVGLWRTRTNTIREQRSQISTMLNSAEMLDTEKRLKLLASFSLSGQHADRDQLLLLQALISPKASSPLQIPEGSFFSLSGILNAICNHLQRQQAFQTTVLLTLSNISLSAESSAPSSPSTANALAVASISSSQPSNPSSAPSSFHSPTLKPTTPPLHTPSPPPTHPHTHASSSNSQTRPSHPSPHIPANANTTPTPPIPPPKIKTIISTTQPKQQNPSRANISIT